MEPATNRFFGITELVAHLLRFIDRKEIPRVMRTSRHLHELCISELYYTVETAYEVSNKGPLFNSTGFIKALARNTQHVRQLSLGPPEIAYYANCVFAYQDEAFCRLSDSSAMENSPQQLYFQQQRQQRQQRPLWLPPPDSRHGAVPSIPPMTLLTNLTYHIDYNRSFNDCSYNLPSFKDPGAILTYFCWIMDLNLNLLNVSLERIIVRNQRDVRLLTTSIFGMKNLQRLDLELCHKHDWEMPSDLASVLFFCCPASLQSISLRLVEENFLEEESISDEYLNLAQGQLQAWEKDEVECGIPATIPRRQTPLLCLTSLDIIDFRDCGRVTEKDLTSILAHCPNLKDICLPGMIELRNLDHFAEEIARLCPNLSMVRTMVGRRDMTHRLAMRLLGTLPEQQVEMFLCPSSCHADDPNLADLRWHFHRHSRTLQYIMFSGLQNVDSRTIQVILAQCVTLKIFSVSWTSFDARQQLCIELEDAIEFPWVCTRLKELTLSVAIPDEPLHRLARDTLPYYNRPAPIALSTAEKEQFKSLEAFYRQIGALTELKTLNLRAVFYDPQGRRPATGDCSRNAFPGMMSLGCEETGLPGFLHHLAGLTKLRNLWGSASFRTKGNEKAIGAREIEWMKLHWPALEGYWVLRK